jgi:hypothetical protein
LFNVRTRTVCFEIVLVETLLECSVNNKGISKFCRGPAKFNMSDKISIIL